MAYYDMTGRGFYSEPAEREDWLTSRALYIASKALREDPYYSKADADEVVKILNRKYPGAIERERMWEGVNEGLAKNLTPLDGPLTPERVDLWLKANQVSMDR